MNNLLMNELGITETKIAILDSLIKFSKSNKNIIKTCDLKNIKSELIKQSSKSAINEAINFAQDKENENHIQRVGINSRENPLNETGNSLGLNSVNSDQEVKE